MSSEMGEIWTEYRRAQQQRRASRLGPRTDEILALQGKGFAVRPLTEYQFRIDGALDLFPIHRRYHDLKTNTRGDYRNAIDIAVRRLRTKAHNKEAVMADQDETKDEGTVDAPETSTADGSTGDAPAENESKPTVDGD